MRGHLPLTAKMTEDLKFGLHQNQKQENKNSWKSHLASKKKQKKTNKKKKKKKNKARKTCLLKKRYDNQLIILISTFFQKMNVISKTLCYNVVKLQKSCRRVSPRKHTYIILTLLNPPFHTCSSMLRTYLKQGCVQIKQISSYDTDIHLSVYYRILLV